MILRPMLAACAALFCANAAASGYEPYDRFVNRAGPDQELARYQAGELGVLLPSYQRMHLYAAWRAIALGPRDLKAAPNRRGGLARALGSQTGGWLDTADGAKAYAAWQGALGSVPRPAPAAPKNGALIASGYLNCPLPSYAFATATLLELARRGDASGARLAAWVADQKQVFKFCGDDPDAPPRNDGKPAPAIAAPAELGAEVPLYWRQMQQYQLAAAAFYGGDFAASGQRFAQIGATENHPLRQWGAYLSLRSLARAASQAGRAQPAPAALAAIDAAAERILREPALAALHEATRAVARAMRVRLTPEARFAELSKLLDDPRADPYLDDHLGDWRVLANDLLSEWTPQDKNRQARQIRRETGFVDWIETLQECHAALAQAKPGGGACGAQRAHAAAEWRRHAGNPALARVWLAAAAALAEVMTPELEQAALRVAPGAPEYLTLRYALTRHYRLSRQPDKARAAADAVLAGKALAAAASTSARNLFLQERFALANSPDDAANYLLRSPSRRADADTGESAAAAEAPQPAADGLRWLNAGLTVSELTALAADVRFGAPLRGAIGVAAWMRADLLGQGEAALKAARQLEQGAPALAPLMRQYRALAGAPERRHAMLLNALQYGLSPVVANPPAEDGFKPRARGETLADMWCNIPAGGSAYLELNTAAEQSPPAPDTGAGPARAAEIAALGAVKTATGLVGAHVLQRAAAAPGDPDLPWLLYVVVQSTRGGCLDADAKALSKNAFGLLHKRFGGGEWARRTPYFY